MERNLCAAAALARFCRNSPAKSEPLVVKYNEFTWPGSFAFSNNMTHCERLQNNNENQCRNGDADAVWAALVAGPPPESRRTHQAKARRGFPARRSLSVSISQIL